MSLRRAKQILYGGFFILVWYAVIAGGYNIFVKPPASCFDNIRNQGEAGIDCGGPCAQVCVPIGIHLIRSLDPVLKFNPNPSHITLLAHIVNPNTTFAAKSFKYNFILYDDQSAVVAEYPGTSFIYAGEVKYIVLPNVALPKTLFGRIDFQIQAPEWVPSTTFEGRPTLVVSGVNPVATGAGITVDGQILNNDTVEFPRVTIVAIFKGNLSQSAGASETEIENLAPNESQPFSIIHPNILNVNLPATQLFEYAARP